MSRLVGYRNIDFTDRDGKRVQGIKFYVADPIPVGLGSGDKCEGYFVSVQRLQNGFSCPQIGSEVDCVFNRYGKLERLVLLE